MAKLLLLAAVLGITAAAPKRLHRREALPDYAITYAPWSYLYSEEGTFPSDVAIHLNHTIPEVDYEATGSAGSVTLDTLDSYSSDVYLTSEDNIENNPAWLLSDYGIPDSSGYSAAPGLIIAAEKNSTTTDVFYFYFYSYNWGRPVLDIEFDLHVGDWEHAMIRFVNSEPYAIYLSEHGAGSAYYWNVMNFNGDRPITYVANGSHANYATAGSQEYTIALGIVTDVTNAGYAWDMTQNYRGYWYDVSSGEFSIAGGASTRGTEEDDETATATWLLWEGHWGDEQYPVGQDAQYCLFDECKYTSGPTGPAAKNLGRTAVCQNEDDCTIFDNINDLTVQSKKRMLD
ncbi:Putative vacuolar protein sorting-associated protein TDA6 [Cytospora mali]|uniref:Vacuolar protein sorting-associated protein TDA6 n=1 Tax=Cytospora mali TaxID=578113 RepID=A0A194WBK1_CYTMA|nr:Putative vacuolar protein sorting-associated protein TDA6 [Valsa mali]